MSKLLLKKRFWWKKITQDGLLKDPPKFGAYYEEEDLNGYHGFETEEEAIAQFMDFNQRFEYAFRDEYTLITLYDTYDKDWN